MQRTLPLVGGTLRYRQHDISTERYVHLSEQSVTAAAADRVSGRIEVALAGRGREGSHAQG